MHMYDVHAQVHVNAVQNMLYLSTIIHTNSLRVPIIVYVHVHVPAAGTAVFQFHLGCPS